MHSKQNRFETLVHAFAAELYRAAYALCGNRETAQDLVQETYFRAWRSLSSLRDEGAVRSWLYTILHNEHARHYQRRRPEARDPVDLPPVVLHEVNNRTEIFVLRRALERLPPMYRHPLLLQVIGGFSCSEIAKMMDISTDAVMTRVARARRRLREDLADAPRSLRAEEELL